MQHNLDLYRRLISIRFRGQLQYRIPFLLEFFGVILVNGTSFLTIALVLQKFEGIGGWRIGEIALLYGMVETAFGVMDMIFSGFDPQHFGNQVRMGTFDMMLLRPVNITLQVLSSEFVLRRLGRIFQGLIVLIIAFSLLDIHWTLIKALLVVITFLSQIGFFGGLFIIGATISFWTIESIEVVNIFTYGGVELITYPMHIYEDWMRYFFTFVFPAIFLNYYPALYLLDRPDPHHLFAYAGLLAPVIPILITPLVGFGMLVLSLLFWQFGIRHYQSTGT